MIKSSEGKSIGKRPEQQDSVGRMQLDNDFYVYVLADGMGGERGGRIASSTICKEFMAFFEKNKDMDNPEKLLEQAMSAANAALREKREEDYDLMGMGTTLIGVLLHGPSRIFHFVSVGDSPLYQLSSDGLKRINANHAYIEELKKMVEDGRMHPEELKTDPARNDITSALMGGNIEEVDFGTGILESGDRLLLASDGIQTLSDGPQGEIAAILKEKRRDSESAILALLDAVADKEEPYQDNTALILVAYGD
ncbi:protein phosphatase [Desulfobotulus alkaliphilus]|uniref:Protein phosphatase n=1 Tax=Desulfobotulus alkaliphilus TaxID=622671 RepID=A0A562RIM4_9BACT|nr:protein phosphatase 2C domain-containing protein [Desulfobotulus alkaliphilus]TWI68908.1 protein phosphatase [Desulfobotulus alkaliphilus]